MASSEPYSAQTAAPLPERLCVAPHPPLLEYYSTPDDRPIYVRRLFDRSARYYDRINTLMSLGAGRRYRRNMLTDAGLRPGMRVLDVAIGTGLVAREARLLLTGQGIVVGLDASQGMLAVARRAGAADALVLGQAEALPFASGSFDLVSFGYGMRHVSDLNATFREFRRVLRTGGTLLVLELSRPRDRVGQALTRLYLGRILPWLSLVITGSGDARALMCYYWDTIDGCVPPEVIIAAMRAADLGSARSEVQFGILRAYMALRA